MKYEAAVSYSAPRATQDQFDAMVSLAYNIGTAGFSGSTVAHQHAMGDTQGAADAFRMWNKSQGAVLPVLVKRREQERAVYLHGHGSPYSIPSTSTDPSLARASAWHPAMIALGALALSVWLLPKLGVGRRLLRA
jgi:hypothetical protein